MSNVCLLFDNTEKMPDDMILIMLNGENDW